MTTTPEALAFLQERGAPAPLLDFVRWAGPLLEPHAEDPEAFFIEYQLALADLAQGRAGLRGSLVGKPPRFYLPFTAAADLVALAFHGEALASGVRTIRSAPG